LLPLQARYCKAALAVSAFCFWEAANNQQNPMAKNTIKHNISCLGVDENLSNVDFVHGKLENS
jgi:hypothetical protein